MVKKTKSKRQNKKKSKKIYGGDPNESSTLNRLGQKQLMNYAANNALSNVNLDTNQKQLLNKMSSNISSKYIDQRNTSASPESNFQLLIKIIIGELNSITDIALKFIGNELNLDLNQNEEIIINQLKGKLRQVINILKSEEVQTLIGELFYEGLALYKPLIEKAADSLNELIEKEVKIGIRIVNTALTELPPVFFFMEMINLLTSLVTALTSMAKFVPAIADSIQQIDNFKKKLIQTQNQMDPLVKTRLNEFTPNPSLELKPITKMNGGNLPSMKKLINERKMIGGKIEKSRSNFLNPNLTLSHLIKPHFNKSRKII